MEDADLNKELQQALARLALLGDLGEALAGTLDASEGLGRVCRLLAQRLGDWCAIDLLRGTDRVERACASRRGSKAQQCLPGAKSLSMPKGTDGPLNQVLRGAGPLLLTESDLRSLVRADEWDTALAEDLADLDAGSAIVTPLRSRHVLLGVLTVARGREHPPFEQPELTVVQELAHHVGLALDNARMHGDTERVAERLQRSLLPKLPRTSGLAVAARYAPSSSAAQVGGDWYDMFPLPGGQHALIVGDVAGHDLRAAISMSQLRNMLRGIACDREEPPESIIRRLDVAAHTLYPGTYASCVYSVLRGPDQGHWHLNYTSAGHPPPLLISPEGESRYLDAGHGALLGISPSLPRTGATEALPSGSTLLLYTDGLVERRTEPIDHGLTRLRRCAAGLGTESPDALCDQVLSALDPDGSDDVALLAVRVP